MAGGLRLKVSLMAPCLADAFYGEAAIATVRVLEAAGHEVEFLPAQTCCGQPAFNYGDREAAATMARRCAKLYGDRVVVTPSTSCAATLRHAYRAMGIKPPKTYELAEFLVGPGALATWAGSIPPLRAAYHEPCHARELGTEGLGVRLLRGIDGLELVPLPPGDACCGFGGAFLVTHHTVSVRIGAGLLDRLAQAEIDTLIGSDLGCLMHLEALAERRGQPLRVQHFAEVLAAALH